MHTYPAVLIGGPPHSGKSVLLYTLSQQLRAHGVEHYALRSCPDYEGDWSQESKPDIVRAIRIKGDWTPEWVDLISRDIHNRHLPLLVDVGGRPTLDQERIFAQCTHAILLTKDDASHAEWCERIARHGIPLLADLTSRQEAKSAIHSHAPVMRGVVSGLNRSEAVSNPLIDELTALVSRLFAVDADDLRHRHLADAPVELTVDLDRLMRTFGWAQPGEKAIWRPEHLPILLDYLPPATPLAVYGRAPNWIIGALARLSHPAEFSSFDARLGWAHAQPLAFGLAPDTAPVRFNLSLGDGWLHVEGVLPYSYIDITDLDEIAAPANPPNTGVILSGRLPNWLYASLALTYASAPWLAVYQPQLLGGAVVVHSAVQSPVVGQRLPITTQVG